MLREKYIARAAPLVFSPGGGDKYGVNLCTPLCGPPSLEEKALRLMMAIHRGETVSMFHVKHDDSGRGYSGKPSSFGRGAGGIARSSGVNGMRHMAV